MTATDEHQLDMPSGAADVVCPNVETTNISVAINNLPPELLSLIFGLVQYACGWRPSRSSTRSSASKWLRITWVCQYWRSVALGTPTLWSVLVTRGRHDSSWLPTFVERARDVPLDVSSHVLGNGVGEAENKPLHPFASRIGRLHQWCKSGAVLAPHVGSFEKLEDLHLSVLGEPRQEEPLELSRERFPRLRSIRLLGIAIRWDTDIFASLQVLQVVAMQPASTHPSPSVVLRILKGAPNLRTLEIWVGHALAAEQVALRCQAAPITRHALRQLRLTGSSPALVYILDRLVLSPECNVMANHYVPQPPSDVSSILPAQSAFEKVLPKCTHCDAYFTPLKFIIGAKRASEERHKSVEIIMQSYGEGGLYIPPSILWPKMAEVLSAAPLTYLSISSSSLWEAPLALWRGLLSRLPKLVHLRISGLRRSESAHWPENALNTVGLYDASSASVICPSIQALELCELTLTPACADLLTRVLDSRAQRNARISELGLVQAFCEPGMNVEKLKADLEERVQLTVKYQRLWLTQSRVDSFRYVGDYREELAASGRLE